MRIPLLVVLFVAFTAIGARAQLVMRGDINYLTAGSHIHIEMDALTNFGDQTTDRVRFRLWASEDPWRFYDRGHLIAFGRLPRLRAHENISDVHRTVHLYRPSSGWYFVTLTLEERTIDESGQIHWEIRDAVEFDGQEYFSRDFDGWPFPF